MASTFFLRIYRAPDTYYTKNDYTNVIEQAGNLKSAERQKTSFPKEYVENADLHKPVLNKIMTTHK